MRRVLVVFVCVAALASGCAKAAPQQDAAAIRESISALNEEFLGCFADAGEAECIASFFSEEGIQLLSNATSLPGPEAIRRYWQQALGWGQWEITFNTQLIEPSVPLAIERGRYTIKFTAGPLAPPNRPTTEDRGTYLIHWRADPNGTWRIAAQAFISEVPARVVAGPIQQTPRPPQEPIPDPDKQ
jgi:ketosteroid isomerase-like protein